jgi:RNA polymerase sigma factor (sigma-70 family)
VTRAPAYVPERMLADLDHATRASVAAAVWNQGADLIGGQVSYSDMKAPDRGKVPGKQPVPIAWDYLQATYLRILENPPNVLAELGQDARPWLRTVLYNDHRDIIRARNRHERILCSAVKMVNHWLSLPDNASPEAILLDRLAREEFWATVQFLLTPGQYEVALLIAQGYSNKEIAARIKVSEAAVRTRLHEARKTLRPAFTKALPSWKPYAVRDPGPY